MNTLRLPASNRNTVLMVGTVNPTNQTSLWNRLRIPWRCLILRECASPMMAQQLIVLRRRRHIQMGLVLVALALVAHRISGRPRLVLVLHLVSILTSILALQATVLVLLHRIVSLLAVHRPWATVTRALGCSLPRCHQVEVMQTVPRVFPNWMSATLHLSNKIGEGDPNSQIIQAWAEERQCHPRTIVPLLPHRQGGHRRLLAKGDRLRDLTPHGTTLCLLHRGHPRHLPPNRPVHRTTSRRSQPMLPRNRAPAVSLEEGLRPLRKWEFPQSNRKVNA